MFENLINFFKNFGKKDKEKENSKDTAKERLHLVLMQDRANVSADFLELMKQEIIEVIKKYIEIDEKAIDVRLTNKTNDDGTVGAPALYANIPITTIKNEARGVDSKKENNKEEKEEVKEKASKKEEKKVIENKEIEEDNKEQEKVVAEEENVEEKNKEEKVEVTENIETEKKAI